MLNELRERLDRHRKNFNKKLCKKNQSELKNTTNKMKKIHSREGINSRLGDTEEHISQSGRQNNGTHPIRTAERIFFFFNEKSLRNFYVESKCTNIHKGPRRIRKQG